jgi:endoglucanase
VHAGDDWGTGSEAQFDLLNKWNQYAVDAIRSTGGNNATRWIGVSGYAANIQLTLDNLVLPKDPANHLMVGVHCYDPYGFCLHPVNDDGSIGYNSWGHNADPAMSVAGNNEEYILALLYKLRTAYIEKGIPCYLGEYGCVNQPSELANAYRKYYLEFFCRAANLAGLPMFIWDNNSKGTGNEACGLLDHANGDWIGEGETLIPMMVQACTSTDSSYDFATIWNKSPKGN